MEAVDVRGLLGLLLVEGSMTEYSAPKRRYVQLTLTAGLKSSAYLEEKVEEIQYFLSSEANMLPYRHRRNKDGSVSTVIRYRMTTERLRPAYNMLYPGRERRITQPVLDILGGHAAGWTWAAGAKNEPSGSTKVLKVGRTEEEACLVSSWLEMLTGARSTVDFMRTTPHLEFTPGESLKARAALKPYAPRTRQHLFEEEYIDDSTVHGARTELLSREWDDGLEGSQEKALA